jgi:hypothetical protein
MVKMKRAYKMRRAYKIALGKHMESDERHRQRREI